MVQHRRLMAPRVDGAQLDGAAVNVLIKEGELLTIGQAQVYPCAVRLAVQLDDGGQKAGGVALGQLRLEPDITDMHLGLGVEIDRAEQAREAEKVLILQPGGAAVLVHLSAQAVAGLPDIRCQVKFRGGKAVLGVANEVAVAPDIQRLLGTLKADADALPAQPLVQVKLPHIAADRGVVPVDLRRAQIAAAIPRVDGVGVLDLAVALQLDMSGHADRAEGREIRVLAVKIRRAGGGAGTVGKAPSAVQTLAQRAAAQPDLRLAAVANMVRVRIQPVHSKHGRVSQPFQVGCHSSDTSLFSRCFSARRGLGACCGRQASALR